MDKFLTEIDAFLLKHSMTASSFGETFAKDRTFVFRIRDGRDCGMRKADKVRSLMAAYVKPKPKQKTAA